MLVSLYKFLGACNDVLQVFFLSFSDFPPASHHSSKAQYLSVSTIDVSDGPNQAVIINYLWFPHLSVPSVPKTAES
jgi:hypothetical protein